MTYSWVTLLYSTRHQVVSAAHRALNGHKMLLIGCAMTLSLSACAGNDKDGPAIVQSSFSLRCGLSPLPPSVSRLPEPTGRHCIGKASFALQDPIRTDPLSSNRAGLRELSLNVWYPVKRTPSAAPAAYTTPQVLAAYGLDANAPVIGTNAKESIAMSGKGRYPVILFSPGLGMIAELYSSLLEELASQGYVVVAINHPYISGPTLLQDGRVVRLPFEVMANEDTMEKYLNFAAPVMVSDLVSVLDWLQVRNVERQHLLGNRLDLNRVAVLGHSFGGSAALQATRLEARLQAAVNMDGTVYGELKQPWTKPIMFYSVASDGWEDPTLRTIWDQRQGPGDWKILPNAGHNDFTDARLVLPVEWIETIDKNSFGSIDPLAAQHTLRKNLRMFFDTYLK